MISRADDRPALEKESATPWRLPVTLSLHLDGNFPVTACSQPVKWQYFEVIGACNRLIAKGSLACFHEILGWEKWSFTSDKLSAAWLKLH